MSANTSKIQHPNKIQYMVTLPKGLVLAKGWKKGDVLEFVLDTKGDIVIKKKNEK